MTDSATARTAPSRTSSTMASISGVRWRSAGSATPASHSSRTTAPVAADRSSSGRLPAGVRADQAALQPRAPVGGDLGGGRRPEPGGDARTRLRVRDHGVEAERLDARRHRRRADPLRQTGGPVTGAKAAVVTPPDRQL